MITLNINNREVSVDEGTSVAVAVLSVGSDSFRASITGSTRGPLCGMGICFECRVAINGIQHQRSCTLLAENGMEVETASVPPA